VSNIRSFPNNQDEYIGAEDVMRWHHGRSSGVFGAEGNASVAPVADAMAVTVSDGLGWLANDSGDGIVWWVDNEGKTGDKLRLDVDMSDAVLPRIDRVVVSWQTTNYVALPEVMILKGTPVSNPVAPALTNDGKVRQISLAKISIPAGTTAIDASMITDERLDDSVCGIVTEKVGVDTSVMQAQFESFWNKSISDFNAYMEQQKSRWDAFFGSVEEDGLVPVPTDGDAGKLVMVNETGDGYTLGAGMSADAELSDTSTNPVQNRAVKEALDDKADKNHGNHVPATETADSKKFLRNDNTWQTVEPGIIGAAPTSHASTGTTYGKGSSANYGHVKLSDATNSTSGVSGGVAATPAAVKAAYDLANGKAPAYTYGTTDKTAGSDTLATGTLYFVYE
jgi:hypothetical protein